MKLSKFNHFIQLSILAVMVAITITAVSSFTFSPPTLDQVKKNGELVVVTRNSPTSYYEGPDGLPTGMEYDLAKLFADRLGVELKIIAPDNFNAILPIIQRNKAHFAAAGITVTEKRKKSVKFSAAYQHIRQQLVYRNNSSNMTPHNPEELLGKQLEVIAGSSHVERLKELKKQIPGLEWIENPEVESEDLLARVWLQELEYTVADSNEVKLNRRFYPELRVAFDLTEQQELAWAFPLSEDTSLYDEAEKFFKDIKANGTLSQLKERHYGHVQKFDYVSTRRFMDHVTKRLPHYIDSFQEAAELNSQDWRLLAAIGYQESHWNPRAISPTGVRGIMMLTRSTAEDMGISNRIDPHNSILGGTQYFTQLKKRIPERIIDPDRTWFSLAAYNIGFGHLEDARIITELQGGDPDKWVDVKDNLPLLMQKRWYKKTRHGYARGIETLRYVENIRTYYDLLVRYSEPKKSIPLFTKVEYPFIKTQHTFFPIL